MPTLTITNISSSGVYLRDLYTDLSPGEVVTAFRCQADLDRMQQIFDLAAAGTITFTSVAIPNEATLSIPAFTNIAALATYSTSGLSSGTQAYVNTNMSVYIFDLAAVSTSDGKNIITPPNGVGRWLRTRWGNEEWRGFRDWWIDSVSGDDEASGTTSLTPIKTVKELSYRFGGRLKQRLFITLLQTGVHPTTDPFNQLSLNLEWDTSFSTSQQPFIQITGTTTQLATGTVTTAAIPVPASNLASQIQDTGVALWTPFAGKLLHVTSGTSINAYAWILKDIGSNTARLTRWTSFLGGAMAAPSPGDTYEIIDVTTTIPASLPTILGASNQGAAQIQFCTITGTSALKNGLVNLIGCRTGGLGAAGRINLITSLITTQCNFTGSDSVVGFTNSGSLGVFSVNFGNGANLTTSNHVSQQSQLIAQESAYLALTNYAAFDCAVSSSGVVTIFQNAGATISTSYYGSGNNVTTLVQRGGRVFVVGLALPTMTGSAELAFDNTGSAIPPFASGGMVPTPTALTTWAQWAAAPFNSFVSSSATGSTIFSNITRNYTVAQTSGTVSVANIAALTALTNPGSNSFIEAFVQSNLGYYIWDSTSVAATDNILVVPPTSGLGKWLRVRWGHDTHRTRTTWFVDPVGGNDEATGITSGAPLKTIKELSARIGDRWTATATITLQNNLPSTDPLDQLDANAINSRLTIIGTQTTVTTSTFTTTTDAVPATNTPYQISDTTVSTWTVGTMIVLVSNGAFAFVMKDLGGGSARISPWENAVFTAHVGAPNPGDSYKTVTLTQVLASQVPFIWSDTVTASKLTLTNLQFTAAFNTRGTSFQANGCIFPAFVSTSPQQFITLVGCYMTNFQATGGGNMGATLTTCALQGTLSVIQGSCITTTDTMCQSAGLSITENATVVATNFSAWDCATGVLMEQGYLRALTNLYGSGNTTGAKIQFGGRMRVDFVPTLTGTTELLFDTSANAIPPYTTGGPVPNAAPISTWAAWNAAPFGKFVTSQATGSAIFSNTTLAFTIGAQTTGIVSVATIAALSALTNPGTNTFVQGFVQSNLGYFIWDSTSAATADNVLVVAPGAGTGRWLRTRWGHDHHRAQGSWFVDPVGGNDEATGLTSGVPIKTIKELSARVGDRWTSIATITLLNNVPSTDPLDQLDVNAVNSRMIIVGTQTTVTTSTFTTTTPLVAATNTPAQINDTTVVTWTVGTMIVVTSGAATGAFSYVLKDLTGGSARMSPWENAAFSATVAGPSAGDSYKTVTLTQVATSQTPFVWSDTVVANKLTMTNVQFTAAFNTRGTAFLAQGCIFPAFTSTTQQQFITLVGCYMTTFTSNGHSGATLTTCASGRVSVNQGGVVLATDTMVQNTNSGVGFDVNENGFISLTSCSVWDTSFAIIADYEGAIHTFTSLYGSGNTTAVTIRLGGFMRNTVAPTITGTTEITFDGATSAIPPLVGGAVVPAASALTTWANLAAAPFNGNVVSYKSGARITTG